MTVKRNRVWVAGAIVAIALTGCGGSRLSHDGVVAAWSGGGADLTAGGAQQSLAATAPLSGSESAPVPGAAGAASSLSGAAPLSAQSSAPASGGGTATGTAAGHGTAVPGGAPAAAANASGPLAPILIGNVGTFSGPVGSSVSNTVTMAAVWAQWTNAHGGIAGHPVEVFSADDGGDPARSRSEIQDMVENRHVIAFMANVMLLTINGTLPYLEEHHIPVIGGDMVSTQWTSSPVLFPVGTTFDPELEATLKSAHDLGDTKYGIFYCVETATCDHLYKHLSDSAPKYGEQIVFSTRMSITQPDYTAQCLGAMQAGAQAIFVGGDAGTAERIAASCARQNYHPLWLTSNQASVKHQATVPALDGMIAIAPVFPWMVEGGSAEVDAYHAAIRQYAPTLEESGSSAITWTSGEVLKRVAAHVGAVPTSQEIFDGLWSLRGETVGGLAPPLTFTAHQAAPEVTCYYVIKVSQGRWVPVNGATYQCL